MNDGPRLRRIHLEQYRKGGIAMKIALAALVCALAFGASLAQGAEYFIYRDPAGKVVLSNITPPRGAEAVIRHELEDVTDEAVRAAREREHAFWLRLEDEQRAESNQNLAQSNYRLAEAIITATKLREAEPGALVQVASSHRSRFDGLRIGRLRHRGHLHGDFRRHSKVR
jgi:hypothetical protein